MKMDGTKLSADNWDHLNKVVVCMRDAWVEARLKSLVDRALVTIQAIVAAKYGENPYRRKHQGSWPMFVRPGLVGN